MVSSALCALSLCAGALAQSFEPEQPIQQGPNPPSWARSSSHCRVDLLSAQTPSGVVGYIGYNVSELVISAHRGVSCARAKGYARANWKSGTQAGGLSWRYVRAWRSSAGSAYVGEFAGSDGQSRLAYLAVH